MDILILRNTQDFNMKLIDIFKMLQCFLVFYYVSAGFPQAQGSNSDLESNPATVIELAIFCDAQFSSVFKGDSEQMQKYWGALVWDAHLKFQGINGTSISFRVNSITVLKDSDEQKIVKNLRSFDGTLPGEQLLYSFSNWLYEQAVNESSHKYDVAVLAVGTTFTGGKELARAFPAGACSVDIFPRQITSSFLISMRQCASDLADTFTHELAHIINAVHDDENDYGLYSCGEFDSSEHKFLMAYSGEHGLQQHMFSPCSQTRIVNFLQDEESSCLKNVHDVNPVVNTLEPYDWDKFFGAVSMEKQCQIIVENDAAYIEDETECSNIPCHVELGAGQFSKTIHFEAFDGTECQLGNQKGNCIFGECVDFGGRLFNAASEKCFQNDNPFSLSEVSTHSDCNSGTPLNALIIEEADGGEENVQIWALDFSNPDYEFERKCLTVNENGVTFEKCESNSPEFVWEMRYVNDAEFLLAHAQSSKCLTYLENSTATMGISNCSSDNASQRWSFVKYGDMWHSLECKYNDGWKDCIDTTTFLVEIVLTGLITIIVSFCSFVMCISLYHARFCRRCNSHNC